MPSQRDMRGLEILGRQRKSHNAAAVGIGGKLLQSLASLPVVQEKLRVGANTCEMITGG